MKIQINERLRPFSHTPGVRCLLPHSKHVLRIYPTLIQVYGWQGSWEVVQEIEIEPTDLALLDLERGAVRLSGKRWISWNGSEVVVGAQPAPNPLRERLSFGDHKKQEIERAGPAGLLPMWFAAGQRVDGVGSVPEVDYEKMLQFSKVLLRGLFWPDLEDRRHMGKGVSFEGDHPFEILAAGTAWMRDWVVKGERLMPSVPAEFHCGKYVSSELSVEWTKHALRRVEWRGGQRRFELPKGIVSCRVDGMKREGSVVELEEEAVLDRFER